MGEGEGTQESKYEFDLRSMCPYVRTRVGTLLAALSLSNVFLYLLLSVFLTCLSPFSLRLAVLPRENNVASSPSTHLAPHPSSYHPPRNFFLCTCAIHFSLLVTLLLRRPKSCNHENQCQAPSLLLVPASLPFLRLEFPGLILFSSSLTCLLCSAFGWVWGRKVFCAWVVVMCFCVPIYW